MLFKGQMWIEVAQIVSPSAYHLPPFHSSIHLPSHLFIHLSLYLSIHLTIHPSIHPPNKLCLAFTISQALARCSENNKEWDETYHLSPSTRCLFFPLTGKLFEDRDLIYMHTYKGTHACANTHTQRSTESTHPKVSACLLSFPFIHGLIQQISIAS